MLSVWRRRADHETAQRSAASWKQAGLGADAVASEAAKLGNGRVRDAALQMMQTEYLAQHRVEQEQKTARVQQGLAAARKGEFDTLPADTTAAMDEGTRQALAGINVQALSGRPAQSAPAVTVDLYRLPPEWFARENLLQSILLRGLSPGDFDEFTKRQRSIRDGDIGACVRQRAFSDLIDGLARLGLPVRRQADIVTRVNEHAKLLDAKTGDASSRDKIVPSVVSTAFDIIFNHSPVLQTINGFLSPMIDGEMEQRRRHAETVSEGRSGYGFFRGKGHPYLVGRDGSPVETGKKDPGGIGGLIEDNIPAGRAFGTYHDLVDDTLTKKYGIPDVVANIPTMPFVYLIALRDELENKVMSAINQIFGTNYKILHMHYHTEDEMKNVPEADK